MPTLRTFIAVDIPETPELRELLRRMQRIDGLPRPAANGLHVTLKFIGDTEQGQIDEIAAAAREIAGTQAVHNVDLRGLGAFPNARRPSVIWVGLQPVDLLATIASSFEERLESLGFARDPRPFQPHVTLLRIKSRPPEALFKLLEESPDLFLGTVTVNAITLYRSDLLPAGPRYTKLAECPLKA